MNRKQRAVVLLGLVISAIFLWFAFRGLHPEEVIDNLGRINLAWLIVGAAWYFLAVAIITLRWQFLLRAVQFIPLISLMPLVIIGYMGNNIYPFRSGEALRLYLLRRNHSVPIIKATTTVIVERVFDGIVMLTFIFVTLIFVKTVSPETHRIALLTAPFFLGGVLVFFALAARPSMLRQLVTWGSRLLPGRIGQLVFRISEDIIAGLEGLRSPAHLVGAILSSYATWAVEASVYWFVSFAFDLNLSYWIMLLVVGTVNLAGLIPASPGQLGVFEFFASAVLVTAGLSEANAVAYAVVVHIIIWLPVTLAGFVLLIRQGLGWSAITRVRNIGNQVVAG